MIDALIQLVRKGFSKITDHRRSNLSFKLVDMLSTGFAIFSLKDPSVSSFREQYPVRVENLRRIYGIEALPGDTALRESLDEVDPKELQQQFKELLAVLSNKGVLEQRKVLGKFVAVSVDGTGHYCSGKKSCPQCMVKNHRNGKQTYYHQLLGAVAVHPEQSTVFPVACEAIVRQDGSTKNDCELNASKRIIPQVGKMLPDEKILMIFDALYANGPHIQYLTKHDMSYIIGIKGDNYVWVQVNRLRKSGGLESRSWKSKGRECTLNFTNGLILNGQHQEVLTNFFEYMEVDRQTGEQLFYGSWITDIEITQDHVIELVKVARSRWKIENETFNTLKNQGYHLEHNYGHGKKYLATNFAILTFLAFLVDQMAQHLDVLFQQAKAKSKTYKAFWEKVRSVFYLLPAMSMNAIYKFIIRGEQVKMPALE
ncbi:unnamed protein product [Discosporangium mesarthrocarpum]